MKKSFTLIEILVVATIIGLLAAVAAVSYSSLSKGSRDARRKADLEQIRAALEMCRSNTGYYPNALSVACGSASFSCSGNTYLTDVPDDPKCNNNYYYYIAYPSGCTNCTDYTIAAHLETNTTTCQSLSTQCGSTSPDRACTYCLGPYGEK